jgi:putative ABC transport system permease protein
MKCIDKMCKANLASSKLRRRLVIWSIILSTILVIGVGNLCISSLVQRNIHYEGKMATYDGYYKDITQRQQEEVIKNEQIKDHGVINELKTQLIINQHKIDTQYVNENYLNEFNYNIEEGYYPKEKNEIAVTATAIEKFGLSNVNIGDEISIDTRGKDSKTDFVISAIIKDRTYDAKKEKIFVSEKYINEIKAEEIEKTLLISVNKSLNKSDSVNNIAQMAGIKKDQIRSKGSLSNSNVFGYTIIILLVIALSIITVSNIFSYTLTERINTIGLLKAVGMTNRQLRQLFKKEGLYYYVKGVSGGIIAGLLTNIGIIVMSYDDSVKQIFSLSEYIKIYNVISLKNNYYLMLLVITCILEMIAILISIKIPSRKVNKMSIVSAIHFVDKIKVKKTKVRNIKFKNPSLKLAYVNLKNNKLKTVTSVLTMSICIILFLYLTSFLTYMDSETMVRRGMLGEDIDIHGFSMKDMQFIDSLQGVETIKTRLSAIGNISPNEVKVKETYIEEIKELQKHIDNNEDLKVQLFSYSNSILQTQYKYIDSMYTVDELKDKHDWCLIYDYNDISNYEIGDVLTIDNRKLTIIGKINRIKYGYVELSVPPILVNDNFILDNYDINESNINIIGLDIQQEYCEDVKEKINTYFEHDDSSYFYYYDEQFQKQKNAKKAGSLLGYVFISAIGIIGILMLINSIYTSIISRKREFGMLRAVGMTRYQFNKYLYFEGNIITILITIIGVSGGYLISKMSYNFFVSVPGNEDFAFEFPYWALSIIIIYYIVIRGIIKISMKRMDKESVVDMIRHI